MSERQPAGMAPALPVHIPSLDGMRAVSIALVLFAHGVSTQNVPEQLDIPAFGSLGNVGVRFFFVISGFLITTLLLRDIDRYGRIRLSTFYVRRALRILPAFLVYVWVIWGLHLMGAIDLTYQHLSDTNAPSAIPDLLHALTFTYNYKLDYNWYYNHLWTLSVEEQFYILWPFLIFYAGVKGGARAALAAVAIVPFIRLCMHLFTDSPQLALSREFQAVCDSIATGCLLSILFNRINANGLATKLAGWPAIPIGGACIAFGYGLAFVSKPAAYIFGQTLANVGIALLLLHVITRPKGFAGTLLNTKPFIAVGILSYSLYLWQEPFLHYRGDSWASAFPQNILLTFAAALASYYLVEKPFLALKDRITTGARSAPVTTRPEPDPST